MNPVKSGNRAISVQTKGQPLAIVAAVTQAPKVIMPTEISSETTLSMVGCSYRPLSPGVTEDSTTGRRWPAGRALANRRWGSKSIAWQSLVEGLDARNSPVRAWQFGKERPPEGGQWRGFTPCLGRINSFSSSRAASKPTLTILVVESGDLGSKDISKGG